MKVLISLFLFAALVLVVDSTSTFDKLRRRRAQVTTPSALPIRINCGGPTITDSAGLTWQADAYFIGVKAWTICSRNTPLSRTKDCDERSSKPELRYEIPVPDGQYNLTLYMSENYFSSSGNRSFDVFVQGNLVIDDLDLFAECGGKFKVIARSFVVSVQGGYLIISGVPSKDEAKLNAIEIIPILPLTSPVTAAPIASPITSSPVASPITSSPVASPVTSSPVASPVTSSPVASSPVTASPVTLATCTIPRFSTNWTEYKPYPLKTSESMGSLYANNEFVLFSGFRPDYVTNTAKSYALDLTNPISGQWRELDPVPFSIGYTHAARVTLGNISYFCGGYVIVSGYVGYSPYEATDRCFIYNHSIAPNTIGQWSDFINLPAQRSGGALFHEKDTNTLIYAAGASKPNPLNLSIVLDHPDVYSLNLANPNEGWIHRGYTPYLANHVGHVTVTYGGVERHFMLGGQSNENEPNGNTDLMYEFVASSYTWIQRKRMPFPRGHFTESAIAWKHCGFFIIAGAINHNGRGGRPRTNAITYYEISTDTWTPIGNFPRSLTTPVCTLHNEYVYCQSGLINGFVSYRAKIE